MKDGHLVDCEYINVESEFAAAVGGDRRFCSGPAPIRRRLRRACSSWRRPSQRLGPRAAGRHDARQPGDRRADQYLERSFRRDVDARRRLDSIVCGDQPEAVDLHQAFRIAERCRYPSWSASTVSFSPPMGASTFPNRPMSIRSCRRSIPVQTLVPPSRCRSARWSDRRPSPGALPAALQADAGIASDRRLCRQFERRSARRSGGLHAPIAPMTRTC